MEIKNWEIQNKLQGTGYSVEEVTRILLENRGITTQKQKEEFFNPTHPSEIALKETGIKPQQVKKAIERVREAITKQEQIIIYGDYDADGVSATAILWECLNSLGALVSPYLPNRFSDGYGLNTQSVKELLKATPNIGLIITVDNGIVANNATREINKLGIDVIITDHHEAAKDVPDSLAVIYTTKTSGSGVAWFFARELEKGLPKSPGKFGFESNLELVAIGTIADQIPLLGINRSLVKHGLAALRQTRRPGIIELLASASVDQEKLGVYDVGFVIAPRINSAGRLYSAIESLRLVCTRDATRALTLANTIGKSNSERQQIVEEVVTHAKLTLGETTDKSIIILSHESYHEGVIGLAASRLVEVFYRPAIVISKGKTESKASARSIAGFNIIEAIRKHEHLILQGGGHTMAAGFSISNDKIDEFIAALENYCKECLDPALFQKKLRIDMQIPLSAVSYQLVEELEKFEPTGLGNPGAVFCQRGVSIVEAKRIGSTKSHLKLVVKDERATVDAIAFGRGADEETLKGNKVDIAFNADVNIWNGSKNLQLKIKDIKISDEPTT